MRACSVAMALLLLCCLFLAVGCIDNLDRTVTGASEAHFNEELAWCVRTHAAAYSERDTGMRWSDAAAAAYATAMCQHLARAE